MMRSLYSGVAGLKTHQIRMDVIGNNIANVNTTAYKSSSMTFSELMSQTTQKARFFLCRWRRQPGNDKHRLQCHGLGRG